MNQILIIIILIHTLIITKIVNLEINSLLI